MSAEVHPGSPRLSAELPETGERFEGLIPPIVAARLSPSASQAAVILTLADYARAGIMTAEQAELLCDAVSESGDYVLAPAVKRNATGGRS